MKTIDVLIEAGRDGLFSAYMDETPLDYSCVGTGKNVKETIADFKKGYEEMKQFYLDAGREFEEVEFTFVYANTVTFLHALKDLFKIEGISKITGVNAAQLGHYIQGVKKPSLATEMKIREGVMRNLAEIQSIKFR